MTKIGIVGPSLPKWRNNKEQINKAIEAIKSVFLFYATPTPKNDPEDLFDLDFSDITLVSGHCPVGEEQWYCVDCEEFVEISEMYDHEGKGVKVYDRGGVDTWAEIEATRLGIKTEIYPAENKGWKDLIKCERCGKTKDFFERATSGNALLCLNNELPHKMRKLLGYRSRNIQIAQASDVLYCIVPATLTQEQLLGYEINNQLDGYYAFKNKRSIACSHCKILGHPNSGGCWTLKYTKKLGKKTHLVIIQ